MNKKLLKKLLHKIKLRTWVSIGILFVLLPLALFTVIYWDSLLAALGGSNATPAGVWHLDEGGNNSCSGGTNDVCDASANTNNGAFYQTINNPTWQPEDLCVSGRCLSFDGSNDASTIADSASLSITGDLSVSAWIKPTAVTAATLFSIMGKGNDYRLALYGDEVRMYIGSASNYKTTDSANFTANNWYYILAIYDASAQSVDIYVNGTLQAGTVTGTIPASITDNTSTAYIGGEGTDASAAPAYQVSLGTDDGWDAAGSGTFNTGAPLHLGGKDTTNVNNTGMRFQSVAVPKDAVINSATLDFNESWGGDYAENVKNKIYGDDQDDCPTFGAASLPRNRTKTTAVYDWDSLGSQGTSGQWYQTSAQVPPPDITDIVEEITTRTSWASGNDMCIVVTDDGSSDDWWFEPRSYEYTWTTANSPRLNVSYGGSYYDGIIDEVKLYNSALSRENILIDMNQGKNAVLGALGTNTTYSPQAASQEYCVPGDASSCTGPVLEWKLDENTGTSTVYDTSGSGYTGTMNGTMTAGDWIPGKKGTGLDLD